MQSWSRRVLLTIDWDLYRFFIAVSETGNLSAAARKLQTSQPRVGRKINALEEYLGARLFTRLPDRYVLSDAGQAILDRIKRIEGNIHDAERITRKWDQQHAGEVTLTTTESLATCWLNDKMPLFKKRYPEIIVQLVLQLRFISFSMADSCLALMLASPSRP